jgi:hypothetical protein
MTDEFRKEEIEICRIIAHIAISFSKVEEVITDLISYFYGEVSKRGLLKKVIIEKQTFNKKYEIFKQINKNEKILNDDVIGGLPKMMRIRNAILHDNKGKNGKFLLNLDGESKEYCYEELCKIYDDAYNLTYKTLSLRLSSYTNSEKVKRIIQDLCYVKVVLRNYKGWFVDIVDLEISDSEGETIDIDYPEYQYNVENYEEEVEQTIPKFLKDKYGVEEGTYDIEPNLEFWETDDD